MTDWSRELAAALDSREPEMMRQALSQVPRDAMRQALPFLERMAADSERDGRLDEALFYRDCIVDAAPERAEARLARARTRVQAQRFEDALDDLEHLPANMREHPDALRLAGDAHEALGDAARAIEALRRAQALAPDPALAERLQALEERRRTADALRQAFDPDAASRTPPEAPPPTPIVRFDPALLDDPAIPADAERFRIDGLTRHLERYSLQASPRNAIVRLQDPLWRDAWDRALATLAGRRVRFSGSELGVFALRTLHHGAAHAVCVERHALDARIAGGIAQKHYVGAWHARHGDAIRDWSEDERRASFEAFANAIDIAMPNDTAASAPCDVAVFPGIDHTLLGTGIVPALRAARGADGTAPRVLPAGARLWAMAIEWRYPGAGDQSAANRLRWSAYPQSLQLDDDLWTALTAPIDIGAVDFSDFAESTQDCVADALQDGRIDAILVWFDLDLGAAHLSSAPDAPLRCLRPAVHAADGLAVQAGAPVRIRVDIRETRVHVRPVPAPTRLRSQVLPSWYAPMLGDVRRNDAYRDALRAAVEAAPVRLALDIGAGTGLLSMLAAEAGVERVVACEQIPAIAAIARDTLAANGHAERVALVEKDCRALQVPEDLPERADLALFEIFDCSLIGEGALHFLAHAREHLLREDARYLPAGARLHAMIVEYRFDRVLDVDASLLNPYLASPGFINVDARTLDYRPLTAPFDLFDIDFATAGPAPDECTIDPVAIADGVAGAVLFWFDLRLDGERTLSNAPDAPPTHWKQGLQFLPEARVERDLALPLVARHNGSALRVLWRQEGLPAERFSRVPRMDPQWLAASQDLEQQTQQLMQHCSRDPDEYRKVADLAQRIAIDPARHGLDPTIAERFMQMFLNAPD